MTTTVKFAVTDAGSDAEIDFATLDAPGTEWASESCEVWASAEGETVLVGYVEATFDVTTDLDGEVESRCTGAEFAPIARFDGAWRDGETAFIGAIRDALESEAAQWE